MYKISMFLISRFSDFFPFESIIKAIRCVWIFSQLMVISKYIVEIFCPSQLEVLCFIVYYDGIPFSFIFVQFIYSLRKLVSRQSSVVH